MKGWPYSLISRPPANTRDNLHTQAHQKSLHQSVSSTRNTTNTKAEGSTGNFKAPSLTYASTADTQGKQLLAS